MKTKLTRELMLEIVHRIKKIVALDCPIDDIESIEIDFEGDFKVNFFFDEPLILKPFEI